MSIRLNVLWGHCTEVKTKEYEDKNQFGSRSISIGQHRSIHCKVFVLFFFFRMSYYISLVYCAPDLFIKKNVEYILIFVCTYIHNYIVK